MFFSFIRKPAKIASRIFCITFFCLYSCKNKSESPVTPIVNSNAQIKAVDISELPEIRTWGINFKNNSGAPEDPLTTLQVNGVNTIRLRLWYNPATAYSGFSSVKAFAAELKSRGFKILLTVHYSDTWADPGHQATPVLWQALGFSVLKDSVGAYTKRIVQEINPEYIQLGNEINGGFLYPNGSSANPAQLLQLLQTAAAAVRSFAPATKIIIHYAGVSGAETFFNLITALDYDIIGISYYPVWHNITLENLAPVLKNFSTQFQKKIMVAETAYPFTLNWNDMTNNIVGLPAQLLSNYPASTEGQKNFLMAIRDLKNTVPSFTGFSYWGASLVAFKGTAATNGSPWENQSLWDFNLMAVPALGVFSN